MKRIGKEEREGKGTSPYLQNCRMENNDNTKQILKN